MSGPGQLPVGTTFPGCVPGAAAGVSSVKPLSCTFAVTHARASWYPGSPLEGGVAPAWHGPGPRGPEGELSQHETPSCSSAGGGYPGLLNSQKGPELTMRDLSIVETLFTNIVSALALNNFSVQRGKHPREPHGNGIWNSQKLAFSSSIPSSLQLSEGGPYSAFPIPSACLGGVGHCSRVINRRQRPSSCDMQHFSYCVFMTN